MAFSGKWVRPPKISTQLHWNVSRKLQQLLKTSRGRCRSLVLSSHKLIPTSTLDPAYLPFNWSTKLATYPTFFRVSYWKEHCNELAFFSQKRHKPIPFTRLSWTSGLQVTQETWSAPALLACSVVRHARVIKPEGEQIREHVIIENTSIGLQQNLWVRLLSFIYLLNHRLPAYIGEQLSHDNISLLEGIKYHCWNRGLKILSRKKWFSTWMLK